MSFWGKTLEKFYNFVEKINFLILYKKYLFCIELKYSLTFKGGKMITYFKKVFKKTVYFYAMTSSKEHF
jgi:hypothetical protein